MSGNVEAKTVHEFEASAERVFDAWLDPVKVRSWAAQPVPGMPAFARWIEWVTQTETGWGFMLRQIDMDLAANASGE